VEKSPEEYSPDGGCSSTGICGNCRFAMGGTIPLSRKIIEDCGAVLQSRVPAFVRLCAMGSDEQSIILLNIWHGACPAWEARA
jgi:hypothetical protein